MLLLDSLLHLASVSVLEWCESEKHFKHTDAHWPPIDAPIILTSHKLRGHVLWRTAHLPRWLICAKVLGHAVINYLQVALFIHHYILKLQVTMTNVAFVKISNSLNYLHCVKTHIFLLEFSIFLQYSPKLTSTDERHYKVEPCFCWEEIVHVQNVLVIR